MDTTPNPKAPRSKTYERFKDSQTIGIVETDQYGVILRCNATFARYLNTTPDRLRREALSFLLVKPTDAAYFATRNNRLVDEETSFWFCETELLFKRFNPHPSEDETVMLVHTASVCKFRKFVTELVVPRVLPGDGTAYDRKIQETLRTINRFVGMAKSMERNDKTLEFNINSNNGNESNKNNPKGLFRVLIFIVVALMFGFLVVGKVIRPEADIEMPSLETISGDSAPAGRHGDE